MVFDQRLSSDFLRDLNCIVHHSSLHDSSCLAALVVAVATVRALHLRLMMAMAGTEAMAGEDTAGEVSLYRASLLFPLSESWD